MKVYFSTDELKEFYITPLKEIRGKRNYPQEVIKQYKNRVQLLRSLRNLEDMRQFRGLSFEYLKGDRKGQSSIRLNDQYRLILIPLEEDSAQVIMVHEISKHYE